MIRIKILSFFLFPLILLNARGSTPKLKDEFLHKPTNIKSPQIIDIYERSSIDIFDKYYLNIRAYYASIEKQ